LRYDFFEYVPSIELEKYSFSSRRWFNLNEIYINEMFETTLGTYCWKDGGKSCMVDE